MPRRLVVFCFILSLSGSASASEAPFRYVSPALIRASEAAVPSFKAAVSDRMDKAHLLVQCGDDTLLGFAKSEAEYKEAVSYWTGVLAAAGVSVGQARIDGDMYFIPYTAPKGLVLRRFVADSRQFKPKDEAALRANMDAITGAMGSAGLRIVLSGPLQLEYLLPTYAVYYLTEKKETRERETQPRVLAKGTDIDWDIVEGAVTVVQKPKPWMMVYLGPEVGQVTRIGKTQEEIEKRLAERVAWLIEHGATMIGSRIHEIPEEDRWDGYRFVSVSYFFR